MKAVVIGDLRVDILIDLEDYNFNTDYRFTQLRNMKLRPGGTVLGMAESLKGIFEKIISISAIGSDEHTDSLVSKIQEISSDSLLEEMPELNGYTALLFKQKQDHQPQRRFAIASRKSPYFNLSSEFILANVDAFERADILLVDCLLLTQGKSTPTTKLISDLGRKASNFYAIDIVPHNITSYVSPTTVLDYIKGANMVSVEYDTLCNLFGLSSTPNPKDSDLQDRLSQLSPLLSPNHWISVRYGEQNIARAALFHSDEKKLDLDFSKEIRGGGFPSGSNLAKIEFSHIFDTRQGLCCREDLT